MSPNAETAAVCARVAGMMADPAKLLTARDATDLLHLLRCAEAWRAVDTGAVDLRAVDYHAPDVAPVQWVAVVTATGYGYHAPTPLAAVLSALDASREARDA